MIFEAVVLGSFVMGGLAWVSTSLDGVSKQMRRANDLKEAELHSKKVEGAAPGSASI